MAMAVTLTTAARNAACDAIVDLLDGGAGDASGDMAFATAAVAVVCTDPMTNPAFGAAATGVATAAAITTGTVSGSANPSTVALCLFRNRANTEIFRCAVGTSGSDINLSSVSVNDGDTIAVSSLTFTMPAS
jgi:TRAP-type uncharacterized transport system substrate-binding protein